MTLRKVNSNAFKRPQERQAMQQLALNRDEVEGEMMRKSVYDVDEDGKVDTAAGGTDQDFSGVLKGSVIVCDADGVLSLIQSSTDDQVVRVQADGTLAWETLPAGALDLLLNTNGEVIVTTSGHIVTRV